MRMKTRILASLCLVLCAAAAHAAERPVFSPRPCPPPLAGTSARCGTVLVPEGLTGGRTIGLNVVVLPAVGKRSGTALFHLEGGPGIAATNGSAFYLGPGSAYRSNRDVVLFDQRGTGDSSPLRCPELERRSPLQEMYPVDEVRACGDVLREQAELKSYSTERAADDIESVRKALGYEKIDIWAISYGTRLAQDYIKRFPTRVSHVVLAGFVPLDYRTPLFHAPNGQRVLDLLFYKCQRDPQCSNKYPHLRSEWNAVLQSLARAPVEVHEGEKVVTVSRGPFGEAVRSLMGTAAAQRRVPAAIHAAAAGDFAPFLQLMPKDGSMFADGLYLTIGCAEGASRIRPEEIERQTSETFTGDYRVRRELAACAQWPTYSPRATFYDPPRSTVPVLVMAGEMDQVAAPEWGYEFCASLPDCRYVLIPDMGHGPFDLDLWTNGSCFDDIAVAFYDHPATVDVSCVRRMRPPEFK
jgi:pimeloyl-ACP methyl ester carboxylesterase